MSVSRDPKNGSESLTTYLDNAGSFDLLDAAQERRQTRKIVQLRRDCWRALIDNAERDAVIAAAGEVLKVVPDALANWSGDLDAREDIVDVMMAEDPDGRVFADVDRTVAIPELSAARRRYEGRRNRFACSNLRLVVTVAKRIGRRHLPLSDRVQEGNIGLLKAIDRFDPERGCRFSTYAAWWIRHAVTRALVKHGRTVRIPAHIHALFTKARRACVRLRNGLGRHPTAAEIASSIGAPVDKVKTAIEAMELRAVGLDDPAMGEGGHTIGDVLPDEAHEGWADRVGESIDVHLANRVIDELDEVAFDIVIHRYGLRGAERRTLRSLGEDYHLSRERIRQLQNDALRGLREHIERSQVPSLSVA